MEIIVLLLIVAVGVFWYFNRNTKSLDTNNDGKVDVADAKTAVENVVEGVKSTADVNKDGKVDVADAAVVVEKATTTVKKAATKAKATAKKAPAKRAAAKKPRTPKANKTAE